MRKKFQYTLIVIFAFIIGLSSYVLYQKTFFAHLNDSSQSPIVFDVDKQSKNGKCEAHYYGMGKGDGAYNPRCYELQEHLTQAAGSGDTEKTKQLLRSGANADSYSGGNIYPLIWAASRGQIETARILLDNGANVNYQHGLSGTPLSNSTANGHAEMAVFLLSRGANINLQK